MRKRIYCALLIVLSLLFISSQAAAWQDIPIAEGKFLVKLPAQPDCTTQKTNTGLQIVACSVSAANSEMVVMITPFETKGRSDNDIDKALSAGMAGSAANVQGEVTESRDVIIRGVRGKDFTVKTTGDVIIQRMLIGHGYIVQAMAMPHKERALALNEIKIFVSSLEPN